MALEEKFAQNKEDLKEVQNVMLRTKTEISQQVSDVRQELNRNIVANISTEGRMDQSINDCKYWMEKYTAGFKSSEAKIGNM